ncbi:hypothetical protein BpHYR1_030433, partial [Brachionus plicatilis]
YLVEIAHEAVIKPSLLATPTSALLPTPEPMPLMNLPLNTDVDERELSLSSADVDLRALSVLSEFDRLKKELIDKIMNNLSTIDSSKQAVMAELLVKLVNTDNGELAKTLSVDAIKSLLISLDEKKTEPVGQDKSFDEDRMNDEDERLDLHIDDLGDKMANEMSPVYAESKQLIQSLSPVQTTNISTTMPNGVANTSQTTPSVAKVTRVDPRLAARNSQQSSSPPPPPQTLPPTSSQPQLQLQTQPQQQAPLSVPVPSQENKIDLLSRPIKDQSLLSSLPDIQLPKDLKNTLLTLNQSNFDSSSGQSAKLTFEDYKRKLQKPISTSGSSFSNSINSSSSSISYMPKSPVEVKQETVEPKSLLPNIPSYTVNLQAPQSLHELLRNFQS